MLWGLSVRAPAGEGGGGAHGGPEVPQFRGPLRLEVRQAGGGGRRPEIREIRKIRGAEFEVGTDVEVPLEDKTKLFAGNGGCQEGDVVPKKGVQK